MASGPAPPFNLLTNRLIHRLCGRLAQLASTLYGCQSLTLLGLNTCFEKKFPASLRLASGRSPLSALRHSPDGRQRTQFFLVCMANICFSTRYCLGPDIEPVCTIAMRMAVSSASEPGNDRQKWRKPGSRGRNGDDWSLFDRFCQRLCVTGFGAEVGPLPTELSTSSVDSFQALF